MTTIAWDSKTLAADRNCGGCMNQRKIFKLKKGGYLAGAGVLDDIMEVARWIDGGMKESDNPFCGKHVIENGSVYLYIDKHGTAFLLSDPWLRLIKINEKFFAVGSGGEFAMGAMAAGANARKAVSIACQLDYYTGKGIDVVRVGKKP